MRFYTSQGQLPIHEKIQFNLKFKKTSNDECWIWKGGINAAGYGYMYLISMGGSMLAHRISYMANHGELKKGLVIDHICRTRSCVNPSHLRQVSVKINSTENVRPKRLRVLIEKEDKPKIISAIDKIQSLLPEDLKIELLRIRELISSAK